MLRRRPGCDALSPPAFQIRGIEEIRVRKKAKAGTSAPVDVAFAAAIDRFVDSHGSQSEAWKVVGALLRPLNWKFPTPSRALQCFKLPGLCGVVVTHTD